MTQDSTNSNETSSEQPKTTQPSTVGNTKKSNLKKWQPGKSGNPAGRPPGSKNAITQLRIAIEQAVRERVAEEMVEVAEKAIDMAKKGDRVMIKLLMEMFVSKAPQVEDAEQGVQKISIAINKLDLNPKPVNVIDVTHEEVSK